MTVVLPTVIQRLSITDPDDCSAFVMTDIIIINRAAIIILPARGFHGCRSRPTRGSANQRARGR